MQAVPIFRSHGQNKTKTIEGVSEPWGLADALCRLSIGDGAHRRDVAIGTFRTWRDVRLESVMRTKANMLCVPKIRFCNIDGEGHQGQVVR
jgi:hypothetical protein